MTARDTTAATTPLPLGGGSVAVTVASEPDPFAWLRLPWHADAACKEHVDDVQWFPERGESSAPAKAVCAACLVNVECLAFALAERIEHGVWAGTSARQRRKIWGTP